MRHCLAVAMLAALGMFAPAAIALPCAGFTDIDDANAFCPNVEWLRNRGVTLGCTSATLYCPNDVVTRLSMAAFLNRLANALTPEAVGGILSTQGVDLDAFPLACQQAQFAVTGSPRLAHGHAVLVAGHLTGGTAQVGLTFVESTDNGVNYTAASPQDVIDVAPTKAASIAIMLPPRVLQIGSSYRYALRLSRAGGAPVVGTDLQVSCEIKVFFENRNGTSPPFDEDE